MKENVLVLQTGREMWLETVLHQAALINNPNIS